MDPRDPITQSISADFEEGLTDPSRAQAILKMLPRLVLEQPQLRDMQATSGLPQTGQEAFADTGALAGQAPSGIGTDVRMGTNMGEIYQNRARNRILADQGANTAELERTGQANRMNIAQAEQGMGALNFAQRDRQIAQQIKINERLLAQDARMRLEFIMEQGKRVGPVDSPAFQAYSEAAMRAIRDPARRSALLESSTGVQAMVGIMDEALSAASGGPPQAPAGPSVGPAIPPRSDAALGVMQRMGGVPETAPAGQASWQVTPAQQADRDQTRMKIVQAEQTAPPGTDPAAAAAQAVQVITPTPPRQFRGQGRNEGASAYEKERRAFDQAEESRYRAEQQLATSQRGEARDVRKDVQKQELEKAETLNLYQATTSSLSEAITNAQRLLDHKGLDNITGGIAGAKARTPNITAEARAAQALMDTVIAKGFLDSLMEMKNASKTGASGFGQLSEKEGAIIRASIGALDPKQDTKDFKAALSSYIDKLRGWEKRAIDTYRRSPYYSDVSTPSSGGGGLKPLPGAGGRISIGEM